MATKKKPGLNKNYYQIQTNIDNIVSNFDEMGLKKELLRGIYGYGMEKPSPIQERAIIPLIQGKDVIAQAQSGMGKTAFFLIGILEKIDKSLNECQALILVPTRELVLQIQSVITKLGKDMHLKSGTFTGGTPVAKDIEKLQNGVHIATGSPGRVLHMIRDNHLKSEHIKIFVLDEADKLMESRRPTPLATIVLGKIFDFQINEFFKLLSPTVQIVLSSATMPEFMMEKTKRILKNPAIILVKNEALTLDGIDQYYIETESSFKLDTLCDIFETIAKHQAIIFCKTRSIVDRVFTSMVKRNYSVNSIHGKMAQSDREEIMIEFRLGLIRVLITSDLLSRGIDVQQVSLVINYDLPDEREQYIHRIGRAGRYGRKGMAINLVTSEEKAEIKLLEAFYNTHIPVMPMDIMRPPEE